MGPVDGLISRDVDRTRVVIRGRHPSISSLRSGPGMPVALSVSELVSSKVRLVAA